MPTFENGRNVGSKEKSKAIENKLSAIFENIDNMPQNHCEKSSEFYLRFITQIRQQLDTENVKV